MSSTTTQNTLNTLIQPETHLLHSDSILVGGAGAGLTPPHKLFGSAAITAHLGSRSRSGLNPFNSSDQSKKANDY